MERAALSTHLTSLELRLPPLWADDNDSDDEQEDVAEPELHIRTAVAALRRCGGLRNLDISSGGSTPAALPAEVAEALQQCGRLTKVSLVDVSCSEESVAALTTALATLPALEHLFCESC